MKGKISKTDCLKKVLYAVDLQPSSKFGTLEEQMFLLATAFHQRGSYFIPLFVSPPDSECVKLYRQAGLLAEGLNLETFSIKKFFKLLEIIRKYNIQIMHWNFYDPNNLYGLLLRFTCPGLTHFFTDHNSRNLPLPERRGILYRTIKKIRSLPYTKIFCISDFGLNFLQGQGGWNNLLRCTHFVNIDRFKPDPIQRAALREEMNQTGNFIVLVVANLIPQKGVHVLLEAVNHAPEEIAVWVVGEGKEQAQLREFSEKLGIEGKIRFLGLQKNVEPFMQAADCLVCPSLWAEAAGLVILEALSTGLPVIGSNVGGIPEIIKDGQTGFLFPPGDVDELREKLCLLVERKSLGARMGEKARIEVEKNYSSEARIHEYLGFYQ